MVKVSSVKDGLNRFRPVWHRQAIGFLAYRLREKILGKLSGRFAVAGLGSGSLVKGLSNPYGTGAILFAVPSVDSTTSSWEPRRARGGLAAQQSLRAAYGVSPFGDGAFGDIRSRGTRVMSAGSDGQVIIASLERLLVLTP